MVGGRAVGTGEKGRTLGPEMGGNGSRNYSPVENVSKFPHAANGI
jgi:hypothetical protein